MSENVSLDGVIEDPVGDEGSSRGGWFGQVPDKDSQAWATVALDEALAAEALLLGRRSYDFFSARWPSRRGPFADRLNGMPKYVVSSTLGEAGWHGLMVLNGDVLSDVKRLKQELNGDIVVYASFQLVHALVEHDLVDELRLMVYPFVLGAGARLFAGMSTQKPLRLIDARTVGDGLAFLAYELVRDARP